MRDETLLKRPT